MTRSWRFSFLKNCWLKQWHYFDANGNGACDEWNYLIFGLKFDCWARYIIKNAHLFFVKLSIAANLCWMFTHCNPIWYISIFFCQQKRSKTRNEKRRKRTGRKIEIVTVYGQSKRETSNCLHCKAKYLCSYQIQTFNWWAMFTWSPLRYGLAFVNGWSASE